MYDYAEKRIMVSMRKQQMKIIENFFDRLFKKGNDPKFIGRRISDIYTENKNSKTRILLCKIFAKMTPEELRYVIFYLRYKHHEKRVNFHADERFIIFQSILEYIEDSGDDFIIYRKTMRDSFTDITAPFEVYSEDFRPH